MIFYSKVKFKIFAFRAIDRFKVCVALTFDLKVISAILSFHLINTLYAIIVLNINTPHQCMKEEFVL